MPTHVSAPWRKPKPASNSSRTKLTAQSVKWAKARAKKAGRRYPNLVDNLAATRRQNEKAAGKKSAASRP